MFFLAVYRVCRSPNARSREPASAGCLVRRQAVTEGRIYLFKYQLSNTTRNEVSDAMPQVSDENMNKIAKDLEDIKDEERAARAAKRRYTIETVPARIVAACDDVESWPTKHQYKRWNKWLLLDLGAPKNGYAGEGWWHATCPINDPVPERKESDALINFKLGLLNCLAVDEHRCHVFKNSTTLTCAYTSAMVSLTQWMNDGIAGGR